MESSTSTVDSSVQDVIQAPAPERKPTKRPRKPTKPTGAPDYANLPTAALLESWGAYVTDIRSDIATLTINTVGAEGASLVRGDLSALVTVGLGLRKAYGRGIKAAEVKKLLPSVTIPDGFNPTFGLFLQAARLRPDDATERKIGAEIRSALRSHIRGLRKSS